MPSFTAVCLVERSGFSLNALLGIMPDTLPPSVTLVVRLINFNRTDNTEFNNGFLQRRFQRANDQENDAA